MWDQPEVHDVYRRWRAIGEESQPGKYFVGEIWVPSVESIAAYLVPDELHQAFTFDLLVQPWEASRMKSAIGRALAQADVVGGPPAWTLSNHDVHRPATRYGQHQNLEAPLPTDMIAAARRRGDADLALGVRRAKAATMLQLALPGATYLYQGEELGLPEVFDLPDEARQDPIWLRSSGTELGRDGCRVPIPWNASARTFGFSPADGTIDPWLPQPSWFAEYAAESQAASDDSALALYRRAIRARRTVFAEQPIEWLETGRADVIAFRRGSGACVVNFGDTAFDPLGEWEAEFVLNSEALENGAAIPPNSAAWLSIVEAPARPTSASADRVREDSPAPQLEPTAL
jgi:alpha-glucosidase